MLYRTSRVAGMGIYLYSSSNNNNLIFNLVSANHADGIDIWESSNNNILNNNTISANIGDGVVMEFSSNKYLLWGNNFFNNTGVQAGSNNINQWHDNQTGNYTGIISRRTLMPPITE